MSRRLFVLAVIVVAVGVVLALWALRGRRRPRAANPAAARATVIEYLRALEARDRNGILKLVPVDYDAAEAIDELLQRFGGARAAEANIRITTDLSPRVVSARIRTVASDGRELAWTENLFWRRGTWWLVLGERPVGRRPGLDVQRPSDIERPAP